MLPSIILGNASTAGDNGNVGCASATKKAWNRRNGAAAATSTGAG
jgi:hypothetical protein